MRELEEEFGTDKFKILKKSSIISHIDWPDDFISNFHKLKGQWYRGQSQHQFLIKFIGTLEDLKPNPSEIQETKWGALTELSDLFIFPNQYQNAKLVIEKLLQI